jgi:hypothetical protein
MVPAPLRVRPIRRLVFAYAINQLGDWAGEMALAVAVFAATGSAAAVAAVWVAHRALLSLFAPWVVARLAGRPRAAVLTGVYLCQAALFGALVLVLPLGVAAIVPFLVADGLLAPAVRALARTTVCAIAAERELLRDTTALLNVVFTANGLLAPIAGGLMVAAAGPRLALLADAASFVAAALAVRRLAVSVAKPGAATARGRVREALRFARTRPVVGGLLLGDAAWSAFVAAITPIEVAFVCGTLGAGTGALGAVLAAWGAGMVAGGAVAARLRHAALPPLLAVAAAGPAVACIGMGASASVSAVLIWSVVGGLGNGAYGMAIVTALQEHTPPVHQACVNALYELAGSVAMGVGFAAGGVIAAVAGPRAVYVMAGAGALAALAATVAALRGADWAPPAAATVNP